MHQLLALVFVLILTIAPSRAEDPPANFKVAFIGDQGLGSNSEAVLKLVKDEGSQLLVHLGDFDYGDNPTAWEGQTNKVLGADFLQMAVLGNHDVTKWNGSTGYGAYIKARMEKMGVPVVGELGKKCSFKYKGIFFVFTTPDLEGSGHDTFIKEQLALDNSAWRISNWHVNQNKMQAGDKTDQAGWPVYEESRIGGAIIATAHEHSYFRTHLLSNFANQTVASKDTLLGLKKGSTFAFVSGLAGQSIRPQLVYGDYIASVSTSTQGANYGALFAVFNAEGNPRKANFYFKDIQGKIIDHFSVISEVNPGPTSLLVRKDRLVLSPERFGAKAKTSLRVSDLTGRKLSVSRGVAGKTMVDPGRRSGVFVVTSPKTGKALGKIVVLP